MSYAADFAQARHEATEACERTPMLAAWRIYQEVLFWADPLLPERIGEEAAGQLLAAMRSAFKAARVLDRLAQVPEIAGRGSLAVISPGTPVEVTRRAPAEVSA